MVIGNFRNYEVKGNSILNQIYYADVDITTGYFWWKKTMTRQICKESLLRWFFVDNGEYTPFNVVDCLERSYRVIHNIDY